MKKKIFVLFFLLIFFNPDAQEDLISAADRFFQAGDFKEAENLYKKYLRMNPINDKRYAECLLKLGFLYKKKNDLMGALDYFRQVAEGFASNYDIAPEGLFEQANILQQIGQPLKAKEVYKKILKHYPDSKFATLARAKITSQQPPPLLKESELLEEAKRAIKEKDYKKQEAIFRKLISLFPNTPRIDYYNLQLAESLYNQKQYKEALAIYEKLENQTDKREYKEYAEYAKGFCLLNQGDNQGAIVRFQEFIKNYPASRYIESIHEALNKTIQIQTNKEAQMIFQKALYLFNKGTSNDLKNALFLCSQIKEKYKDTIYFPTAQGLCDRINILLPQVEEDEAERLYQLAKEKKILGKEQEAKKIISRIKREYPRTNYVKLAEELEKNRPRKKQELFKDFPKPKDFYQRTAFNIYNLAKEYYQLDCYRECLEELESLRHNYKDTPYAKEAEKIKDIVRILKRKKDAALLFKEALGNYQKGNYHDALWGFLSLIERYKETPFLDLAIEHVEKIREKVKREKAYQFWKEGKILREKGNYKEALDRFNQILREYPESFWVPYALFAIGEIFYFNKKDYKEASLVWQRIVDEYPRCQITPGVLYHLGDCLEKLGKYKEAKDTYQKLLFSYPESLFAQGNYKKLIEEKLK